MRNGLSGYWIFAWLGLLANIAAIPFIALVVSSGPPLQLANLWVAIFLAWPAAIVGIVAASGLFAERRWGVIMSIIALSMAVSGTLPYGIFRLINEGDLFGLSGLSLFIAILNLIALIYWCKPGHRKLRL
tara:strand:- start:51813 stop:52202 length:390 start_codon:yes stop_codon:yes gene_type:complete